MVTLTANVSILLLVQEVGPICSSAGECNGGCPYKILDEPQLRAALGRLRCSDR